MATPLSIRKGLTETELAILSAIALRKVMSTTQIVSICFDGSNAANLRQTQRLLKKLKDKRLVISRPFHQARQGFGTTTNIWAITKQGLKISYYGSSELGVRLRRWKPRLSIHTLEHILAITDTEIALKVLENESGGNFRVELIEHESSCWRKYDDEIQDGTWLKPDLYVETSRLIDGKCFRFKWFLEVDLSTERPCQILAKCQTYINYWCSVRPPTLPLILWVVPDSDRKKSIGPKITDRFDKLAKFFEITTTEKLADMMLDWLPNKEVGHV